MHAFQDLLWYRIADSGKHLQIQLYRLFGEENLGKFPTNKM